MPRKIMPPNVLPEAAAYWQAANQGRLLVKHCTACGQAHHYPRDICPHCLSDATEWRESTGVGQLYSFSTMGQGDAAYTIAFVTLDEGVTLMTNLVGQPREGDAQQGGAEAAAPINPQIGARVKVVFEPAANGQAVPMFALA